MSSGLGCHTNLLKPRSCECWTACPHTVSVGIEGFCSPRTCISSAVFGYRNVVPYNHPADVVSCCVKPEHFERHLIDILLKRLPNGKVGRQCSRIGRWDDLSNSTELILMKSAEIEERNTIAAITDGYLNVPDSDNSVVTSVFASCPCCGLHTANKRQKHQCCPQDRLRESVIHLFLLLRNSELSFLRPRRLCARR